MAERGKARYTRVSAGSNTLIKSGSGTLYGLTYEAPDGAIFLMVDGLNLGAVPDLNAEPAGTVIRFSVGSNTGNRQWSDDQAYSPGIGFNTGLVYAATSNARGTIRWE